MNPSAASFGALLPPGTPGPALIAHAAGNSSRSIGEARIGRPDYVEVDLWVHRDHLEARHERRLPWGLPLLFEKWYLARPRGASHGIETIVAGATPAGVFFDLKSGGPTAVRLVAEALRAAPPTTRFAASSQWWPILRDLAEQAEIPCFYSIDVQAKLDLFLSLLRREPRPAGVSCEHRLLDRATVDRLHEAGLLVVAWTVDDLERAAELAGMGVDGITTHRVSEVRERLGAA